MKKAIALGLSAVMAAGLVACGGSTSSSTPASSGSSEPAAPSTGTEITYWSMWTEAEPQGIAIKEAAEAFEKETGVHVNIEWKGRDINTTVKAALDAGEKIDVFDDDMKRMSQSYIDNMLSLEEMAAAADYENHAIKALPEAVRGWAGELVCIPYQPYTSGVFYTQSSFDAAGITEEPTTWEEFLEVCQKLKDAGYTPLAQDSAYTTYTYGFILARMIGQDAVMDLTNNGGWGESAEAKQAAQYIVDLREKGYLSDTCPDEFPNGENELGFGTAAMVVNASWVPNEITNNTHCDETWGMFNFPSMTENDADPITVANIGGQALGINKDSEHPQEAFDFIMFLTTGEYDAKISESCNAIPADPNNTEWPEMLAGVQDDFVELTGTYEWNMGLNVNVDVKEGMGANIQKLFEGTVDAQGFVDAMDALY